MKRVVVETNESAFESLMGKTVTLMCANYFYTGELVGVNDTCVALKDPKIVYETGDWSDAGWGDAQSLPTDELYIQMAAIESFGELK